MRPLASAALAAAFVLAPVAAGYAPAYTQDFSITNPSEPADPGRRDLMRQLQAWWEVHAFYPRHASNADEAGTVKVHLVIFSDGRIWMADMVGSSGSPSLDAAGTAVFRGGYVRPFPPGAPTVNMDVSLHYVLAHRHDQPVAAGYTPMSSRSAFTIMNDPVKSPILETMLQRTCTGSVVRYGIRNSPIYGLHHRAEAIFFRRPDGTPWVKFYEGGFPILAPVTEVGKMVQWTGREEHHGAGSSTFNHYTVWSDGDNNLNGNLEILNYAAAPDPNHGGTVDFTCATDIVPAINWQALSVNMSFQFPSSDPP